MIPKHHDETPYSADRSLYGKLRRRMARLMTTRPARLSPDRPLLTVSFDDAPVSAAEAGAAVLERHGARGTYFISAGLAGRESHLGRYTAPEDVTRLAAAGHEIACHTFSHLDCGKARAADIAAELDASRNALAAAGVSPATFAYPYGDVSPQAKTVVDGRYLASRALHHGLVTTGVDLNQTPGVGIEGQDGEKTDLQWLHKAADAKAWLILYTHDVRENPSPFGCTPDALERLVCAAEAMGFEFVTFEQGAQRASHRIDAVPAQAA